MSNNQNIKNMKNEFQKNDGGRSIYHRCDRKMDSTGDCVVRAIAIALRMDYKHVKQSLFDLSMECGFMPNDEKCFEQFLNQHGWIKKSPMKNQNNRKFQLGMMPVSCDMIVHTTGHVVAVVDGVVHDTYDSREWCANSYYIKK